MGDHPLVPALPFRARRPLQRQEDPGVVVSAEVGGGVGGGTVVGHPAPGGQDQHPVAQRQVLHRVGDHHDRAAVVGQLPQQQHDLPVQARVQAGRRLVQVEQLGSGQQLQGHRGALALPAGQPVDAQAGALGQAQLVEHLHHAVPALVGRGVAGEAQLGAVLQRLLHPQLGVQQVRLGHEADPLPHLVVAGVEVPLAHVDAAALGRPLAGQRPEEGGLARAAGADDGQHAAGRQLEGHVVQDRVAADGDLDVRGHQRDAGGLDDRLEAVAGEDQGGTADADAVAGGQVLALDPAAVDVGPPGGGEVHHLRAVAVTAYVGVVQGDQQVVQDQVVVGERPIRAPTPRARTPVISTPGAAAGNGIRTPAGRRGARRRRGRRRSPAPRPGRW